MYNFPDPISILRVILGSANLFICCNIAYPFKVLRTTEFPVADYSCCTTHHDYTERVQGVICLSIKKSFL